MSEWKRVGAMMGGSWGYYPDTADGAVYYESGDGLLQKDVLTFPDGRRRTIYRVKGGEQEFGSEDDARAALIDKPPAPPSKG